MTLPPDADDRSIASPPANPRPADAPRVLITGISGVGKSAVLSELRQQGHRTLEMDDPGWSYRDPAGHQRWHLDRLRDWLDASAHRPVFVGGCSEDQAAVTDRFDHILLLTAPLEVMRQRISDRAANPYGKTPGEWSQIVENHREVLPRLHRRATACIDTTPPLDSVVRQVLQLTGPG